MLVVSVVFIPEAYAILTDAFKSILPYECDITRVCRRESPGKEGRDTVAAHYTEGFCQLRCDMVGDGLLRICNNKNIAGVLESLPHYT